LEDRVEQRTRGFSALYDVTSTVNQSFNLEPVRQRVIQKITGVFGFDATRILLFNCDERAAFGSVLRKPSGTLGTGPLSSEDKESPAE
jgi:hypothetical protein